MFRFLALLSVLCCGSLEAADKPNIVVFLVDDMGVMDTSVPFLTDKAGKERTIWNFGSKEQLTRLPLQLPVDWR